MTDTMENKVLLKVEGMTCGHCVSHVKKALDETPGVIEAKVELDPGSAEISIGAGVDIAGLIAAVEKAGYTAVAA